MTKKEVYKELKRIAAGIPEEGYYAMHKVVDEKGGMGVNPEVHKSNHYRRLKSVWNNTQSFEEINKYLLKFNMKLEYGNTK